MRLTCFWCTANYDSLNVLMFAFFPVVFKNILCDMILDLCSSMLVLMTLCSSMLVLMTLTHVSVSEIYFLNNNSYRCVFPTALLILYNCFSLNVGYVRQHTFFSESSQDKIALIQLSWLTGIIKYPSITRQNPQLM